MGGVHEWKGGAKMLVDKCCNIWRVIFLLSIYTFTKKQFFAIDFGKLHQLLCDDKISFHLFMTV